MTSAGGGVSEGIPGWTGRQDWDQGVLPILQHREASPGSGLSDPGRGIYLAADGSYQRRYGRIPNAGYPKNALMGNVFGA